MQKVVVAAAAAVGLIIIVAVCNISSTLLCIGTGKLAIPFLGTREEKEGLCACMYLPREMT